MIVVQRVLPEGRRTGGGAFGVIKAREMQEAGEKAGRESAADVRFPRRDGRRVLPEGRRTGGRLLHEVKSAQAVFVSCDGEKVCSI